MTSNLIIFNQTKDEEYNIYNNFRHLHRHIRSGWEVEIHQNDEITEGILGKCRIFVLPCPRVKFTDEEFSALRKFLKSGGSLLVLSSEGGEEKNSTNVNFLLEEFGISFNNDSVIRTIFHNYFDPKEALISNGVLNRSLPIGAGVLQTHSLSNTNIEWQNAVGGFSKLHGDNEDENNFSASLNFVFPYGCTLSVNRESVSVLSTGTVCYPVLRPVCAFHQLKTENGNGRLAVCGSVRMFVDEYFNKEDNSKIFDVILKFLSGSLELNQIDANEPNIFDEQPIPDNMQLSCKLKLCLHESEFDHAYFGDFIKLFDQSLTSVGLDHWPEAKRIYEKIGLRYEPLTLVTPTFQVPMPPYQPAVFPPQFRELPQPQLELFELDDAFSTHEVQLAQLTNRCAENELDMYIREASEILGINKILSETLTGNDRKITSKRVLDYVTRNLIEWKKSTAGMEEGDDLPHTYLPAPDESVEIDSDWTKQQNNIDIMDDGEENFDHAFSEIYND
uniref:Uncharacterized protein n=1 Tax=Meloidogyne incognita TaxID=6306 RepID=A0A914LB86_MELIC